MSHNLLRVNNTQPIQENIPLSLNDAVVNEPSEGDLARISGGAWEAMTPVASPPQVQVYSQHPTGSTYATTAHAYGTGDWAYTWIGNYGSTSRIINNGVTPLTASATYTMITNSNFYIGLRVNVAGRYLIRAVPSFQQGWAVCRLYHTSTSATGGVYFGNSVYINAADGKTGSTLLGVADITTARIFWVRLTSEAAYLSNYFAWFTTNFQIKRIA